MAQNEFAIIQHYFSAIGKPGANTVLGIGDDAAVVEVPAGCQQVISMDTLIAGVHFPDGTHPADIAYKALAVNLSDLAAMAATPSWFLLSLSLPQTDSAWLAAFAEGLAETALEFELQLIGGDTCHGALSITLQIAGLVPTDKFVTRAGANSGDLVLVSGNLGTAGLALAHLQEDLELPEEIREHCLRALNRPLPRLELADFLRRFASAAIDISDGLLGDLGHILKSSQCGARIDQTKLPVLPWIEQQSLYDIALGAGDDYEICCTVPARYRAEIESWNRRHAHCQLSVIGEVTASGFFLQSGKQETDLAAARGYRHFE